MPIIDPDQGASLPSLADLANNQSAFANFYANVLSRNNLRYTNEANRTALHPANTEGEESYLVSENRKELNDGAAWISLAARSSLLSALLTSNVLLTLSSTALQNIAGFSCPVVNGGTYYLEGVMIYDSSTTADIKFSINSPAAGTSRLCGQGLALGATTLEGDMRNAVISTVDAPIAFGGIGVGTLVTASLSGFLTPSASGTLQLRAAQNTVDATQSTLRIGSWMRVVRTG